MDMSVDGELEVPQEGQHPGFNPLAGGLAGGVQNPLVAGLGGAPAVVPPQAVAVPQQLMSLAQHITSCGRAMSYSATQLFCCLPLMFPVPFQWQVALTPW